MQAADDLTAPVNDDQRLMLRAVWSYHSRSSEWPTWRYVTQWLARETETNPSAIRDSFPIVGTRHFGQSYSVIQFDRNSPNSDDDQIKLTIAAGLHLLGCRQTYTFLVRVISELADRVHFTEPDEGAIAITNGDVKELFTPGFHRFIPRIPYLLDIEPRSFLQGSGSRGKDTWIAILGDDLLDYVGLHDITEYVQRTIALVAKDSSTVQPVTGTTKSYPQTPVGNYINTSLIDELTALNQPRLHVGKLVAMLRELNVNYAEGHTYSSMMLARAILDHIPPVFGFTRFSEVANQTSGLGETDKKYLRRLTGYRFPGDDALHRLIRETPDLIDMQDMPLHAELNALVRLVIDRVK